MLSRFSSPQFICLYAAATLLLGCSNAAYLPVSSVPLGLGPLAIAEQEQQEKAGEADRASAADNPSRPDSDQEDFEDAEEDEQGWFEDEEDLADDEASNSKTSDESESSEDEGFAKAFTAFEGLFSGEDVAIFRFPGQPKQRQEDPNAKIRIELGDSPTIRIVLINSDTGEDLCTLEAEVQARSSSTAIARLDSGQPCFTSEGSTLSAIVTSGRATIRNDQLTLKARGDLELSGGAEVLAGNLRYSFSGQRD